MADAKLSRLNALVGSPKEQAAYALEILETERSGLIVQAALEVLAEHAEPAARPVLLKRYAYYDADWLKRDAGGYIRSEILKAMRDIARRDDIPLLERAATTYEYMPPGRSECAERIRAAAIIAMHEVDEVLAGYHCVRLLADPPEHIREMSGEPAVTAVRILASRGNTLPLYYCLHQTEGAHSEVASEALRCLTRLPSSLLPPLVERFRQTDDEIVLIGLFDLLLAHEAGATFADLVGDFLRTTRKYDVYRYLVAAIVASRNKEMLTQLLLAAEETQDRRKVEVLIELLAVRQGDRRVDALVSALRGRLTPGR